MASPMISQGLANIGNTGSGGGNPATTVTGPDAWGAPPVVGTDTQQARAGHDHGLPQYSAASATGSVATFANPSFSSGVWQVLNANEDVMLYIAYSVTSPVLFVLNLVDLDLVPHNLLDAVLLSGQDGLLTIRIPSGWGVELVWGSGFSIISAATLSC